MRLISVLVATLGVIGAPVLVRSAELRPCGNEEFGERAECGTVTVLEDRSKPQGRSIDLNVLVLRGTEAAANAPLFVLAGGPGQAATDLTGLGLGPWAAVLETRDMVFVDQRGTGDSNLITCPNRAAEAPASSFGKLFDADEVAACLERVSEHADVRLYGTEEVVADLDEVRRALGYDKVVLWGGSGGTRTALVWLKRFPERVEAATLDGVTPTYFRSPSGFARSAQMALDRVFEDCAAQESCNAAFPGLGGDFDRILRLFDAGPVATTITRDDDTEVPVEMTRGDFTYAVRGLLYSARSITGLPKMIHEAAASGDVSPFAQRFWQRDVALRPVVSMGVHLSSICTEDMPFIDNSYIPQLTDATFLSTYLLQQYGGACERWRRGAVPGDYLEPTRSRAPVLLVSGYYDPSTPAPLADEVARHLPNSRHIVVRNESHGAEFGCARQTVIDFLISASLDDLGPACEGVGAVQFEVE